MGTTRSIYGFRNVIFDLDGTLIDSMRVNIDAFASTLAPYGITRADAEECYRRTVGQPLSAQYPLALAKCAASLSVDGLESLIEAFDARVGAVDVPYFAKVPWLAHELRRRGTALFLTSGSSDAVVADRLRRGGVRACFTLVLGSTAMPKGPRHVAAIIDRSGLTAKAFAETAAFVGDSEYDMRLARECGAYAIGVLGTVSEARLRDAGAKRIVPSVSELYEDRL